MARSAFARQGKHQPNGKWLEPAKKIALVRRDRTCAYCGVSVDALAPSDVTIDHLIPRSWLAEICERDALDETVSYVLVMGVELVAACKPNDERNLVVACRSCNSARGAKAVEEFADRAAIRRIRSRIARPLNMALARRLYARRSVAVTR